MSISKLVEEYLAGIELLEKSVEGLSDEELDARPIAGMWSIREVVCHIADFEPIYADRMKRVIAEERPTFFGGDPDLFAKLLAYQERDVAIELALVSSVRKQLASILSTLEEADLSRQGIHSDDGPLDLRTLLTRIIGHVPHHVRFIEQKRQALK